MGLPLFHKLPLGTHGFRRLTVGLQRGWDSLERSMGASLLELE